DCRLSLADDDAVDEAIQEARPALQGAERTSLASHRGVDWMHVAPRGREPVELGQTAGVILVGVRDNDVSKITRRATKFANGAQDRSRAARITRVDQRESVVLVINEMRIDLPKSEFIEAGSNRFGMHQIRYP